MLASPLSFYMSFTPPITDSELKAIAELSGDDLSPFVATAQLVVDEHLSTLGLSSGLLREIGKYLAAHFALLKEGQVKSESVGPTSTSFNMASGQGLASTTLGQQAISLDPTGTLYQLANPDKSPAKGVAELDVY